MLLVLRHWVRSWEWLLLYASAVITFTLTSSYNWFMISRLVNTKLVNVWHRVLGTEAHSHVGTHTTTWHSVSIETARQRGREFGHDCQFWRMMVKGEQVPQRGLKERWGGARDEDKIKVSRYETFIQSSSPPSRVERELGIWKMRLEIFYISYFMYISIKKKEKEKSKPSQKMSWSHR